MRTDELKNNAISTLGRTPEADICVRLIDELLKLNPQEGRFLTLTSFQNLLGKNSIDATLVLAVQFLTSSKYSLLTAHGQLIDEDGEEFTLASDDFDHVLQFGSVIHPNSGEMIEDAQSLVCPFFTLAIPDNLDR